MRKPILDEPKRRAICGILTIGGTYKMAAKYVGCSCRTIFNTAKRDPEFRQQLNQTQVSPEITFLKTLHSAGQEKWQAAKWGLQHMYPDRYGRRPRTIPVDDVKEILSQILQSIMKVIHDRKTRAAVLKRVRSVANAGIQKAQRKGIRRAR